MLRLRRCANFALALVLSVFAVAPHQHDGLAESLFKDTITQVGNCDAPHARHFHASRTERAHPCVACARQHSAGALRILAAAGIRPVAVHTSAILVARPFAASITVTRLRGPPA